MVYFIKDQLIMVPMKITLSKIILYRAVSSVKMEKLILRRLPLLGFVHYYKPLFGQTLFSVYNTIHIICSKI